MLAWGEGPRHAALLEHLPTLPDDRRGSIPFERHAGYREECFLFLLRIGSGDDFTWKYLSFLRRRFGRPG